MKLPEEVFPPPPTPPHLVFSPGIILCISYIGYVPVVQTEDMASSHLKVIWIFLTREMFIAEYGILDFEIRNPAQGIPNPESQIPNPEYRIP